MGSFVRRKFPTAILLAAAVSLLATNAFAEDAVGKNRPPRFTDPRRHGVSVGRDGER
jgi:hypothetical protein